jgi:hypothetical protein
MSHEEMLRQLRLTEVQFRDLLQRYANFMNSLDADQKAVIKSTSPSLAQAAASFGPGASEADLLSLVERFSPTYKSTFFCNVWCLNPE